MFDLGIQQKLVNRGFNRALNEARSRGALPLGPDQRYVIFSDMHKGARNAADDFQQCEGTYKAALRHYLEEGFTLIVLGDAEELWEESAESVLDSYREVMELESQFHPDRYLRVFGNHDSNWASARQVHNHLHSFFPGLRVYESVVFNFDGFRKSGEILLAHGHQGTIDSEILAPISRVLVRGFWRTFQLITGHGGTTPASDACLRARIDTRMYQWTETQEQVVLITGHTHRPVWSSRTHLEKLMYELYMALQLPPAQQGPDYGARIRRLRAEIKERREKFPPCNDTIKTQPSYFNTGCCRFDDGDITGIEFEGHRIRLIRWSNASGQFSRDVMEQALLEEIFFFL